MDGEKRMFIVVEVPLTASAREIEDAMNAPYANGYCLDRIIASEGVAVRALYRRRATVPQLGHPSNLDGKEAEALDCIRNNPKLSARKMSEMLTQHGIRRGHTWICRKKAEMFSPVVISR